MNSFRSLEAQFNRDNTLDTSTCTLIRVEIFGFRIVGLEVRLNDVAVAFEEDNATEFVERNSHGGLA